MNAPKNPLLVGIIAGLVAAILMAAGVFMPLFMQLAAMTVLFLAGLGFGRIAGLIAVATTATALGVLSSSWLDAISLGIILLPAAVMSHLASLARPASEIGGPDTSLAWYPLSDVLFFGAILVAVSTIFLLYLQPMEEIYALEFDRTAEFLSKAYPEITIPPDSKSQIVAIHRVVFPFSQGAYIITTLFGGFYFATRILSALGRSGRPREDMRSSLRVSRVSTIAFAASIFLMFAGQSLTAIGASFGGAIAGTALLAGYAVIHDSLRAKSWALPGLVLIYLFLPISALVAIALGLANPRRAIALSPNRPDQTPANQN